MSFPYKRAEALYRDLEARDIPFRAGVSASELSTLRAGGEIAAVAEPESYLELKELSRLIDEKEYPFFVMGALSNTLVSDEGFPLAVSTRRFKGVEIIGERVYAGAGEPLQSLIAKTARAGLAGLEVFTGIPASVGGAAFMNAGCFGKEISQAITGVSVFDFELLRGGYLDREEMNFSYRKSGLFEGRELILAVEFRLEKDLPERIRARGAEYLAMRRETQPKEPSLGSAFLRPDGASAGYYIDKAGLKGERIGGIAVSEKHAGFFVNLGGGTADEYVALLKRVKTRVAETFDVRLEPEVKIR